MAKIAVVGCGAMGSVLLPRSWSMPVNQVHAVTLWPDHAEAMATRGLRCDKGARRRSHGADFMPRQRRTESDPAILVIIATKAFDVEAGGRVPCISFLVRVRRRSSRPFRTALGSPEIAAPDTWRGSSLPSVLSEVSALR